MRTLLALLPLALSGCVIMEPSPAVEAVELVGSAVNGAVSLTPDKPQGVIKHAYPDIKQVCIVYNEGVGVVDFVPAVQGALRRYGVDSRVYLPGTAPNGCTQLSYSAYLQWDRRAFSDEYSSYMTFASLTLRQNGQVLGSAYYQLGRMGMGKWATTDKKIEPVVRALFSDEEAGKTSPDGKPVAQ